MTRLITLLEVAGGLFALLLLTYGVVDGVVGIVDGVPWSAGEVILCGGLLAGAVGAMWPPRQSDEEPYDPDHVYDAAELYGVDADALRAAMEAADAKENDRRWAALTEENERRWKGER